MTLRLYDTASRAVRDFVPVEPGKASIYLCGLTVQGPPHIGHLRSSVAFDILRRWLEYQGLHVTFIRNLTDVDDKILRKAADAGVAWWEWAARHERAVTAAYDALGCLPASYEPRATAHIPEMVQLVQRLVETGHAYANDGDVFFDVNSFPAYGQLSGQKLAAMRPGDDVVAEDRKRDPRDFALWKAAKPGEPSWSTPWGPGRPGWHLECSAMASRYLGPQFDIHGGGIDLLFPHHENERAQSNAAGEPFAQYWMHNGWVTMSGEKMSKSLGNTLLVSEVVKRHRPEEVRYYLGAAHYRSHIEYSEAALVEAAAAYRGLERFLARAERATGRIPPEALRESSAIPGLLPDGFIAAMDDDLGVPAALATVHEAARTGNVALDDDDVGSVAEQASAVEAGLSIFGLAPSQWSERSTSSDLAAPLDAVVHLLIEQRNDARNHKNYPAADAIRDALKAAGIDLEDTPAGTRWAVGDAR